MMSVGGNGKSGAPPAWRHLDMRTTLSIFAVLLAASVLAPAARAQASVPVRRPVENLSGSYARFSASLTYSQPFSNPLGTPSMSCR